MEKGVVNYDQWGRPICGICGRAYDKLMTHVNQKHGLSAREYKEQFGLDVSKSIMSLKSKDRARKPTIRNQAIIQKNLVEKGKKHRFKKGSKGRPKDKLSEQSKKRLQNQITNINKNKTKK